MALKSYKASWRHHEKHGSPPKDRLPYLGLAVGVRSLLGLMLLFLAACGSDEDNPTPSDTLLGDGSLPKVVVTVELPATPTLTDQQATVVTTISPTIPPRAGTPTATLTPYVGVFIGQPTSVDPEGNVVVPPTIPPLVVIQPGGNPSGGGIIAPAATPNPGGAACSIPVADTFQSAYNTNPTLQSLGCPREAGYSLSLVFQPFEQGRMFWRDTQQIFVLSNSGSFWRVPDNWNESIPADDPTLIPPPNLMQPVRGFGYVWRTNETIRNSLGWAVVSEFLISSYWQEFEGGSVFLGDSGLIFAIPNSDTGQYIGGLSP